MKNHPFISYFWQLSPLMGTLMMAMGCTLTPHYCQPPEMNVPTNWHSEPSEGTTHSPSDCFIWWQSLNDPLLNDLMECAAQQNLDLFIAGTRVLEARLAATGKTAELYPHVDGSLTAGHLQYNKKALINKFLGKHCSSHDHSQKRNLNFFEIGFDATWEIDLFGFHQYENNAAQAKVESSEAKLHDIWVSLAAEIARNYIELRSAQQERELIFQQIENQQETLLLTQELLEIEIASAIDVQQAQEQLNILSAETPLVALRIDKAIHRLSILLGYGPGDLNVELCESRPLPLLPFEKPIGIPSDLLRKRPDIRLAERELAAATESVGSAVAALFPRLSLYGFIGDIGASLRSLTNGTGATWFAAPQLLFPIFNSRLLTQDVKLNKIRAQQALFQYQKTVLEALEEAENAIASLRYAMERNAYLTQAQQAKEETYLLTEELFHRGIKDYLELLAVQRQILMGNKISLQNQTHLLLHYVALYKALGGEWNLPKALSTCASVD